MSWNGKTLEEALMAAIVSGQGVNDLATLISMLPESRKEFYREKWKEIVREINNAKNKQHPDDQF